MITDSIRSLAVPLDSLHPDPANVRRHPEKNLTAIKSSLTRFGQQKPIVVDANGVIVAGNGTWEAAKALGWTEIAAIRTDLAGPEAVAFAIADNRTAELATWDNDALGDLLRSLEAQDIPAELLGFDQDSLIEMFGEGGLVEGITDPDDVPAPPDEAITQPGDLWILGDHRLLCGDSGSPADVDRLLDGAPIHLVNTDPPYNVKVEPASAGADTGGQRPNWRSSQAQRDSGIKPARGGYRRDKVLAGKRQAKGRRLQNDFMTDDAFEAAVKAWFGNLARVLQPGRGFYIWGGGYPSYAGTKSNNELFPYTLRQLELRFSQMIIWDKGFGVINRKDFMGQYEVAFYGWKEGAAHVFLGPNNATDVWHVKKVNPQSMIHLTEKPVELAVRAMQYSSRAGENVLDLFGGSGSTLIAAEQTGRRAFLMELDPPYCDVICDRFQRFTGKPAVLERTGTSPIPMKPREENMR